MIPSMIQAWAIGVGILLIADAAYLLVLSADEYPELFAWALWLSPGLAALATAYLAPRKKFLLGASMAVFGAVFTVIAHLAYQAMGIAVDFAGSRGAKTLFTVTLVTNVVLCAIGSAAGCGLSRRRVPSRMAGANSGS